MLVTYSLTIRRLQLEAAKCYTDPDDHIMVKPQKSDRLRRHRSTTKRHTPSKNISSSSPPPSPRSPILPETDDKQTHHQWP
jgi:hypothetical protein